MADPGVDDPAVEEVAAVARGVDATIGDKVHREPRADQQLTFPALRCHRPGR